MTTALAPAVIRLLDAREVATRSGHKVAKLYADLNRGVLPQPIKRGAKFARWPEHEIDAILRLRIAGGDDDAVRGLVQQLHARRAALSHG